MKECPNCKSKSTYFDGNFNVCIDCGHIWNAEDLKDETEKILDSNGNVLSDGDTVVVIKELKVKGSSKPIKQGTKIRNISLIFNSTDGHNINCKIEGFGSLKIKSEFVKK